MSAIIEFQGFTDSEGNFIVKELAIIAVQKKCCNTWLFKLPQRLLTKESSWLRNNYHGLTEYSGDVDYSDLESILHNYTKQFKYLLTKGAQKASFLTSLLPKGICVANLELYGCPSLKKLTTNEGCLIEMHMDGNLQCARKNCFKLADWCEKNKVC